MATTVIDRATWPTTRLAAERLGCSTANIRRLILAGTLKTIRVGPMHLIDPASIEAFEAARRGLPIDAQGRVINRRRTRWQPA